MKKFTFPLERALDVRKLRRLVKEQELGSLLGEVNKTERQIDKVEMSLQSHADLFRRFINGKLDLQMLKDIQRFESVLADDKKMLVKTLERQQKESEKVRKEAVRTVLDETAIKNYKERYRRNYSKVYWRQENKHLDEIGSMRHVGKGGESS